MRNIEAWRNKLQEEGDPGHEIGTFLLAHTNCLAYLIGHLEGYLAAAHADLKAESAFVDGVDKLGTFFDCIFSGDYDGLYGLNQFRHDVSTFYGHGSVLDDLLKKYEYLPGRERLTMTLAEFIGVI